MGDKIAARFTDYDGEETRFLEGFVIVINKRIFTYYGMCKHAFIEKECVDAYGDYGILPRAIVVGDSEYLEPHTLCLDCVLESLDKVPTHDFEYQEGYVSSNS